MLSAFLKKLLFARQLYMSDGRIEVLGTKQVMLPSNIIVSLQRLDEEQYYTLIKAGIQQNLRDYTKRIGSTSQGMFKITEDIFETFGMGRPEILIFDQKKKVATIRFHGQMVAGMDQLEHVKLVPAALAGMFSFLFDKDINCTVTKCDAKMGVCEYQVS